MEETIKISECGITIGCPPGNPRPNDLLPGVLEGGPLTEEDFEVESKCFGDWRFRLKDPKNDEIYQDNKKLYEKRLRELYGKGKIRYAAW